MLSSIYFLLSCNQSHKKGGLPLAVGTLIRPGQRHWMLRPLLVNLKLTEIPAGVDAGVSMSY